MGDVLQIVNAGLLEHEANLFAMALLMPREAVFKHFYLEYPDGKVHDLSGVDRMAKKFVVAPRIMFKRLEMLGLMKD